MRHRNLRHGLGRSPAHRASMERNMICSVIQHERIVTTLAKAKAVRRKLEKMITLGKDKSLTHFRRAIAALRDEAAARKLFDVLGPRYASRPGGYSRILRLSRPRVGDGGDRAILELVDNDVLARQLATATSDAE